MRIPEEKFEGQVQRIFSLEWGFPPRAGNSPESWVAQRDLSPARISMTTIMRSLLVCVILISAMSSGWSETLRHPASLEQQLGAVDPGLLAAEARRRGDPRRGALVFYKSAAACVNCHGSGETATPLGPDLATLGDVTDTHVIESLLHPSKSIRKGYETFAVLTAAGNVLVGLKAAEDDQSMTLRLASDLTQETTVNKNAIETIKPISKSLMPEGLVASLPDQRDFLDLACYVMEVAGGGKNRAAELKPSPQQLVIEDDSVNLDHAGIIRKLGSRDFDTGKGIYHGYCFNCHGTDGNTPSLPTARAFGNQPLKFGNDPYRMFMTLTRGNGLMAAMSHLTPKQRYQVVHYIREEFVKPTNPDYFAVDADYLKGLPEGTENGTAVENVERDFGPALASQLQRKFSSVLTAKLGELTVSYDLHSMDQADIWRDGFLDLSNTQHVRARGEGTANPEGTPLPGLGGWAWGHEETLDYSRQGLLPRGPLPTNWMDYRGHHLHGDELVLQYEIDGREILELPRQGAAKHSLRHALKIGPGKRLVLAAAAAPDDFQRQRWVVPFGATNPVSSRGNASEGIAVCAIGDGDDLGAFTAAGVWGEIDGVTWNVDRQHRLVLAIPADDKPRQIEVLCVAGNGLQEMLSLKDHVAKLQQHHEPVDFDKLTAGGPLLWPEVLTTVGYPGLEQGAYVLDTLTIPDSTPWNTWFRTSALDFFPDGRMVLATHGGDIWIVSGIDAELMRAEMETFRGGVVRAVRSEGGRWERLCHLQRQADQIA